MTVTYTRSAIGTLTTVIDGVATTGLRNLANNTARLSGAITPGSTPALDAGYRLKIKFGANLATTGVTVAQCWFVRDVGNAGNYENVGVVDGSTTVYPLRAPDFIFVWDGASAHGSSAIEYMASIPARVIRPMCNHKILFRNVSGQTTANANDTDSILSESTGNDLGT